MKATQFFALASIVAAAGLLRAEIVTEAITYEHDGTQLEGLFAYDNTKPGPQPGVIVVHDWKGYKGANGFEADRVRQLAELGYVALAIDVYGQGVRPTTNDEAGAEAGKWYADRARFAARVAAGLDRLKQHDRVNPEATGAIGFCFGGTAVLELARSGAEVTAVVSFHGNLDTPKPDASNVTASVLALHGAIDPYVSAEARESFETEMEAAGVDWQLITYGGAVHSFTNPAAQGGIASGAQYDAVVAGRAYQAMTDFFNETLGGTR